MPSKDITLTKTGSVTGSGTKTIGFNWGKNTSRSPIRVEYTVNGGSNRLIVTQECADLFNDVDGQATQNVQPGNADQIVTFHGTSNAKFLKLVKPSGVTASAKEYSGSTSGNAIGTTATQINNFEGGNQSYGYDVSITVPYGSVIGETFSASVVASDVAEGGASISRTFTATVVHIECSSMEILGVNTINNEDNEADYRVQFVPENTTQKGCTWTLTDSSNNDVSDKVTLIPSGITCKLRVIDTSVDGLSLRLKATNTYKQSMVTSKTITATYHEEPSIDPEITVNPTYVEIAAVSSSDSTPVITLSDGADISNLRVLSPGGFIGTATIQDGHVVTTFFANSEYTSREGSVILVYIDPVTQTELDRVTINYVQLGKKDVVDASLSIDALYVRSLDNTISADFRVTFNNRGTAAFVYDNLSYTLSGIDANYSEVFTHAYQLPEKTVAAGNSETEQFDDSWTGSLSGVVNYRITVRNGSEISDTKTMDGNDSWIVN